MSKSNSVQILRDQLKLLQNMCNDIRTQIAKADEKEKRLQLESYVGKYYKLKVKPDTIHYYKINRIYPNNINLSAVLLNFFDGANGEIVRGISVKVPVYAETLHKAEEISKETFKKKLEKFDVYIYGNK